MDDTRLKAPVWVRLPDRIRRKSPAVLMVTLILLLGACAAEDGGAAHRGPHATAEVVTDRARMAATPDTVAAGDILEVRFPQGDTRGPGFVLERWSGEGWNWEWSIHVESEAETPTPDAVVWTAEFHASEGGDWDGGPAFDDTEPHLLPIPHDAQAGRYRACTGTARLAEPLCAEFDLVEGR